MGCAREVLRLDFTASGLRVAALREKDGAAARRILALALIVDGADRTSAARTCGMDRQTLRDRVHRYNEEGLGGLRDRHGGGPSAKLSEARRAELAALVETGPDPALHQVVRWRRVDLRDEIKRRFGVELHERSVGKVLASLGYRRLSVRPQHPKSDPAAQEAFKKTLARRSSARSLKPREENRSNMVPGRSAHRPAQRKTRFCRGHADARLGQAGIASARAARPAL